MGIRFSKYQGTGNDFILIDNRDGSAMLSREQVARLCDRRFGIGADGLMLLELVDGYDFRMVYYNSDGRESSMCGNGGRCIAAFAYKLGLTGINTRFLAIDGGHEATLHPDGMVSLQMADVGAVLAFADHYILDTGSPHYVQWVDDVDATDVFNAGRAIRQRTDFAPDGINVNFVQRSTEGLKVRTYERGVEDETLSCGTGVTAAAIAASGEKTGSFKTLVTTPGGNLEISFDKSGPGAASNVILKGPAFFVFEGMIET
jgi:diaminopimelate epimerase